MPVDFREFLFRSVPGNKAKKPLPAGSGFFPQRTGLSVGYAPSGSLFISISTYWARLYAHGSELFFLLILPWKSLRVA